MKRNDIVIIIVVLITVTGLVLLLRLMDRSPHYNWTATYQVESDEPYGTEIFYTLLQTYFPGKNSEIIHEGLQEKLQEATGTHNTCLFVGEFPYYTDSMFTTLLQFVARGNDVFLAVSEIPEQITDRVIGTDPSDLYADTVYYLNENGDSTFFIEPYTDADASALSEFYSPGMTMNFYHNEFRNATGYRFTHYVMDKPQHFEWKYFMPDYVALSGIIEPLGTIQSRNFTNFLRIPHGDGYFYIHVDPLVFTNYFMLEADKVEYAGKVLSYLKPGNILWDEYSRSYAPSKPNNDAQAEGPLRFILSQPALRAAWYSILTGLLLFVLFRARRMQRPIPVLEPNENKSLEFVQTIGRMYFLRRNHKQLAHQKMRLFLHFVQERYQIPTAVTDDAFREKLCLKSEIGRSSVDQIFKHYNYMENTNDVTGQDLIELHRLLDHFYKHCK